MNTTPIEKIEEYLEIPSNRRPLKTYDPTQLEWGNSWNNQELERLSAVVNLNSEGYPKHKIQRLLIDLAWASSTLEGNSYSYLDTQVLIEYGQKNKDKPVEDAVMILNHKRAIEILLERPKISESFVLSIHSRLADGRGAPGSRHFLDPEDCGTLREYTGRNFEITGTSYLPPQAEDYKIGFIHREFSRLIEVNRKLGHPIAQSFYLATRIPYLQPFCDVNKRTSRICCNGPLIENGLSPISFVDFDKQKYIKGLIAFYELGDERLFKRAFIEAHIGSSLMYKDFSTKTRIEIANNRDACIREAVEYVESGSLPENPIWISDLRSPQKVGSF